MALMLRGSPSAGLAPQDPDGMVGPLRDGVAMVASFSNRGKRFYMALAKIAHLLPDKGEKAQEGMRIVTDQRKWMMSVFGDVGAFVGKFYTLEKNFLYEMRTFWETGSEAAPMSMLQKNAKATMLNLNDFRGRLDDCLAVVARLEESATAVKRFNGQEMTLQDACMEQLATFGGTKELEARLKDHLMAMQKVTNTQREMLRIAGLLHDAEGKIPELSAKFAVLDSICNNEKRTMNQMTESAKSLEDEAKKKAEAAGHAMNQHTVRKVCGITVWEYKDNKGDAEKERARKLREYAKEALQDSSTQQEKVKKATDQAASVKGELQRTAQEKDMLVKQLGEAEAAYQLAKSELQEVERKDKEERERFGGMSLKHIAELRHHMQEFPGLLAPQTANDRAMFTTMRGHLESHKAVMNRMQIFLDCKTHEEAVAALKAVRPAIKNAMEQAAFYEGELGGLKCKIENDLQKISYVHTLQNGAATLSDGPHGRPSTGGSAATSGEPVVSLTDDDEEPW